MRLPLKRIDPGLYDQTGGDTDPAVRLRYLGTAGFVVEGSDRTLVIDPFLTRPDLPTTLFKPMLPDAGRLRRYIPHADDVLVGHAHYDHVLDAPELCRQTGARFIGSRSACNVARAAGLAETQLVETAGREDIACGDHAVARGLPSRHGRVYFGRVTLPGTIERPPPWPPRLRDLPHGLVLNWHLTVDGVRIVHIDSADFIDDELRGQRCDVLCCAPSGGTGDRGTPPRPSACSSPGTSWPVTGTISGCPTRTTPYCFRGWTCRASWRRSVAVEPRRWSCRSRGGSGSPVVTDMPREKKSDCLAPVRAHGV